MLLCDGGSSEAVAEDDRPVADNWISRSANEATVHSLPPCLVIIVVEEEEEKEEEEEEETRFFSSLSSNNNASDVIPRHSEIGRRTEYNVEERNPISLSILWAKEGATTDGAAL